MQWGHSSRTIAARANQALIPAGHLFHASQRNTDAKGALRDVGLKALGANCNRLIPSRLFCLYPVPRTALRFEIPHVAVLGFYVGGVVLVARRLSM